jgi:hypothetical protein
MTKTPDLPIPEVEFLNYLPPEDAIYRAARLYSVGWSYAAIAHAFDPPIHKNTLIYRLSGPLPSPSLATAATPLPLPPQPASKVRSISPKIPPEQIPHIRALAAQARRYRAKMGYSSPAAEANRELTEIAHSLYTRGVPIIEIAKAAGVTYRAMHRRIYKKC